jgi:hypothetical protein
VVTPSSASFTKGLESNRTATGILIFSELTGYATQQLSGHAASHARQTVGFGTHASACFRPTLWRAWLHNSDTRNSLSSGRVEPQRGEGICGEILLDFGRLPQRTTPHKLASSLATLPRESDIVATRPTSPRLTSGAEIIASQPRSCAASVVDASKV